MKLLILLILLSTLSAFCLNTTIQAMQPDTWYEVPNSRMDQVCADPAQFPGITQGNARDCDGAIDAWSGGAFDTKRNRLIVWGGGHHMYYGNEIYAFDLDDFTWERVTDPSPVTSPDVCVAILSDGCPNSRHTYSMIEYAPNIDKFLSLRGSATACRNAGGDPNTWSFDFETKKWTNLQPAGSTPRGSPSEACAYDAVTGKIFYHCSDYSGLWVYDPNQNQWMHLAGINGGLWGDHGAAVDTKRGLLIFIGGDDVRVYDIRTPDYTPQNWSTTGGGPVVSGRPGVNYDPVADRIVAWSGGSAYTLNMDTKAWTQMSATQQTPSSTGTYGRFRYSPAENAYVLVNSAQNNVLIYKLTAGAGIERRIPVSGNLKIRALPNPFNTMTKIVVSCQLSAVSKVQLSIFNVAGKQLTTLIADNRKLTAGISWDASGYPSGIYIAKVKIGKRTLEKKLFLHK
jgi:hypothetical protein